MKIKHAAVAIALLCFTPGMAQKSLQWSLLQLCTYSFTSNGTPVLQTVPAELDQLDGKEVMLSGYLVPIDYSLNLYALSRFPQASCFFCGQAGPETVIELDFSSQPHRLVVDKFVLVKGKFKINREDSSRLFFQLAHVSFGG